MYCPECGHKNADTSKFCQGCGKRLESGGSSAAEPKAPPPAPPTPPAGGPAQKSVTPPPPPPPVGASPTPAGAGPQGMPGPRPADPSSQPVAARQPAGSPGLTCPVCGQMVAAGKSFCTSCGNQLGGRSSQPAHSASMPGRAPGQAVSPAGVGVVLRAVAAILDGLVLMIISWIMASMFGTTSSKGFELSGAPFFIMMLIGFLYFVVFEGTIGATPGKLAIGLRVVKTDGSGCGISSSVIRNVLRIVDALPFFYLVGIILIATSQRKQRLGDRLAGTLVVKRRGGGVQAETRRPGGAGYNYDYNHHQRIDNDSSFND